MWFKIDRDEITKNVRQGLPILGSLWKNGNEVSQLPEVTGVWIDRKWTKFETGNQHIFFWKAYKNCLESFILVFFISCHQTVIEVFEVWSAAMTSSPEVVPTQKVFIDFLVFGPNEFNN